MMVVTIGILLCLLATFPSAQFQEQTEHRNFQYNTVVDPATGRYNFAYDTGNDNDIAHSMHMQYQDADGIVRGRYGYTDPNGKLRVVEYEAGPNGFVARGDVGPDGFPHDNAPAPASSGEVQPALASYSENSGEDFDLDPAPVQMAGWDPEVDPMNQVQPSSRPSNTESAVESENSIGNDYPGPDLSNQYTALNVTSYNALELYGPELGFYTDRYPRVIYSLNEGNVGSESENTPNDKTEPEIQSQPILENKDVNIYNIDVDPDSIRVVARSPVRRSAEEDDANQTQASSSDENSTEITPLEPGDLDAQQTGNQNVRVPYSYRRYYSNDHRDIHDHHAEEKSKHASDHDHSGRYYVVRPTHDPEQNKRRQTHDHDAEQNNRRQTHDHDAEKYLLTHERAVEHYRTHNHAPGTYPPHEHASSKYKTHDHDAERTAYIRRVGYYNGPRRIFYRDSHSMEPHEHYDNPVYRNYRDHQHSDVHLYSRYRNNIYPGVVRSSDVRYIPSDRYHDKGYYWRHK